MASINFTNYETVIPAAWLNDVNTVAYTLFGNGTSYTGALTLGASGNITVNTNKFTVDASTGNVVAAGSITFDSAVIGGGYGSTGVTISSAGNIQANGTLTVDGTALFGATAKTWTTYSPIQLGPVGSVIGGANGLAAGSNFYYNSGYKYTTAAAATLFDTSNGAFTWYEAASGSADAAITWLTRMSLDASGNLGLGVTPNPAIRFLAKGSDATSSNYALALRDSGDNNLFYVRNDGQAVWGNSGGAVMTLAATGKWTVNSSDSSYALNVNNTYAPYNYGVKFTMTADANAADAGLIDIVCGASVRRFAVDTNGGVRNFSINNINLSDATAKKAFQKVDITSVWAAHKAMRNVWCLYRMKDQTHDDPNMGYTAQGVPEEGLIGVMDAWASVAPWIVGEFDQDRLGVYDYDLHNFTGAIVTELQWRSDDHESRLAALEAKLKGM